MVRAWRILKAKHAGTAFDGEGARLYGGRWNSRGIRVVYTSETLSLAALESLVHLNPPVAFKYVAISVEFDEALVEVLNLADLPNAWTEEPPSPLSMAVGDQWVREARSPVLALPSVIIPTERNYLLNPAHPQFRDLKIGKAAPFSFDPRLL